MNRVEQLFAQELAVLELYLRNKRALLALKPVQELFTLRCVQEVGSAENSSLERSQSAFLVSLYHTLHILFAHGQLTKLTLDALIEHLHGLIVGPLELGNLHVVPGKVNGRHGTFVQGLYVRLGQLDEHRSIDWPAFDGFWAHFFKCT